MTTEFACISSCIFHIQGLCLLSWFFSILVEVKLVNLHTAICHLLDWLYKKDEYSFLQIELVHSSNKLFVFVFRYLFREWIFDILHYLRHIMHSKTKIETKKKTKLLIAVCRRACAMRAPYRVPSRPPTHVSQTDKKLSSNNPNKKQSPLIAKSCKEKIAAQVGIH